MKPFRENVFAAMKFSTANDFRQFVYFAREMNYFRVYYYIIWLTEIRLPHSGFSVSDLKQRYWPYRHCYFE